MSAPGIPWQTWTPEAAAELRESGEVVLAWAAGVPWVVRFSVYDNRFVVVETYQPLGGDPVAFARINPPVSAEVGEAERLLPMRLVPRFHLSPDESAWR
jgi:hypothetical protein